MASESQIFSSPSISRGTRRVGEYLTISRWKSGVSSGSFTSWNGTPKCLSTSQGRSDQDDRFLLPMTKVSI